MANRRSSIPGVIEETAPPVQQAEVSAPMSGRPLAKVRSTMDLPHDQHMRFKQWALDAEAKVGRAVPPQQVLRALVARLLTSRQLTEDIVADLRKAGQ